MKRNAVILTEGKDLYDLITNHFCFSSMAPSPRELSAQGDEPDGFIGLPGGQTADIQSEGFGCGTVAD